MSSNSVVQEADLAANNEGFNPRQAANSSDGNKTSAGIWLARTFLLCVAGILAWFTWGHWGDFQIDSGREIYVPVAILQGKLLFRDICYMYGPLAPYVQALLFRIFGIHLTVLYLFGLVLTTGSALWIFEIARQFDLEVIPALVPPLLFLSEAFSPFIFNFVFPYSYAATLAAFFGLACLYFTIRHGREGRPAQLAIASLFAAFVVLAKQEFAVACLAILGFEIVGHYFIDRSFRALRNDILLCVGGLSPALAVYGWFTWRLSAKLIFFDNWISTPGTFFMRTFAKHTMAAQGFRFLPHEILQSSGMILLTMAFWFAIAAANAVAVQKLRSETRISLLVFLLDFLIAAAAIVGVRLSKNMLYVFLAQTIFPQGLFFAGVFFVFHALWKLWRNPELSSALPEVVLGIYATLVSVRVMMELTPSAYNYSVFYNVPLFLIFIVLLTRVVRSAGRSLKPGSLKTFVAGMLAAEAVLLVIGLLPSTKRLPAPLTTEFGTFYTRRDVTILFPQIVSFMKSHTRNRRDILVLPEPPSLYVFAGMQAPTEWYSVLPGMVDPDHEQEFIHEATANEVRYVLISNRSLLEYGVKKFGVGYDETIYQWISENFKKTGQFGPLPNSFPDAFIMNVFERKDLASAYQQDGQDVKYAASFPRVP